MNSILRTSLLVVAGVAALGFSTRAIAGELKVTPFAQAPVLKNVTAVHVDNRGRVFAVETSRRKGSEWYMDDRARSYGLKSIEEKRAYLEELRKSGATIGAIKDNNGDGKLTVADLEINKEKIHLLEDRDGDGKAELHKVFAEGWNDGLDGIGAGVLAYRGDVFFTCFPSLWKLRDEDGDGVADKREVMHTGFAIQVGQKGHDLHGPAIGPYGRLYWSLGDRGFSVVRKEDGRRFHYPYHGAVVRCELDGGNFEVYAAGLRNNVEFAWDKYGNMISADNDGDYKGELERLVYILEGSDTGWRRNWQFQTRYNPWMAEKMYLPHFKDQPAHITPPIANFRSGPCGFAYEPGTALNEKYRGCFIMNYAPAGKMFALRLEPEGAAFKMTAQESIPSAGTPTGLNFGPDGALYIADWSGGYDRNDKGGVFKLDDPEAAGSPVRKEVQKLLGEGMGGRSIEELKAHLGHADMRIRQEAQFELVGRGEVKLLGDIAADTKADQMARVHALRGIAQGHRTKAVTDTKLVADLLADSDPEIRAQAAMAAREIGDKALAVPLEKALADVSPRVQLLAAMALGRCGSGASVPALIGLLAANDGADAFIRFGAYLGLGEIGDEPQIVAAKSHPSAAVRIGAVVALRRMASPKVAEFLDDADPRVVVEAARAIHDDHSIPEALEQLGALAGKTLPDNPALIRRVLNANVRVGSAESARHLATFASNSANSKEMRVEALDCLRTWCEPDVFDRVEGNLRKLELGKTQEIEAVAPILTSLAADANKEIQGAFAGVVKAHGLSFDKQQILAWLGDRGLPMPARVQAFEMLVAENGDASKEAIKYALGSDLVLQLAATVALQKENPFAALEKLEQLDASVKEYAGQRKVIAALGQWRDDKVVPMLLHKVAQLGDRSSLAEGLRLDVIEAAKLRPEAEVKKAVAAYEAGFAKADPLAPFRDTANGGDPAAGERLFREHPAAQCVRCHRVGGEGSDFGPDLAKVATRLNGDQLLESLINPSAQIAEGFALVTIETKGGETIGGTLRSETKQGVVVVLPDGSSKSIPSADIKEKSTAAVSTMPPMSAVLKKMEIRDVLAYLRTLK
ncbi:MAG: HEAT repeat domain-containing protein [Akkermansiaceae bacterium]|nr:HEAT repeat domain-containing protein [Akkermansiaceae bacterium]